MEPECNVLQFPTIIKMNPIFNNLHKDVIKSGFFHRHKDTKERLLFEYECDEVINSWDDFCEDENLKYVIFNLMFNNPELRPHLDNYYASTKIFYEEMEKKRKPYWDKVFLEFRKYYEEKSIKLEKETE